VTRLCSSKGKQTLGVGHQYAFGQNTPITGENYLAKMVMKYFAPANQSLGLHWAPYNNNVLPPIIDVNMTKSACEKLVLVYLPFEEQSLVTEILNGIADKKFVQYSSGLANSEQDQSEMQVTFLIMRHHYQVLCRFLTNKHEHQI